jgi:hypothetical protein
MSETAAAAALRLECHPSRSGNLLIFPYTLTNEGPGDVYAMHAFPGSGRADEKTSIVIASEDGDAILGKFIPSPPTDGSIAVPALPLARRLAAGASLEGRIEIPVPLAETSPYFPDLTLRRYELVDIKGVQLTIGYWPAEPQRIFAEPCPYAPDLFEVSARDPARAERRVSRRFPTTGLELFKRTDAFPRTLD